MRVNENFQTVALQTVSKASYTTILSAIYICATAPWFIWSEYFYNVKSW